MTDRAPLLDRLRALPGPVWVLAGGQFINKFGAFVLFFLVVYLTDLGYSPAQAGLAAGAYGLG
ncbi:MAG: MFS transporter, partial [Gemmatimonadetes bacterium]|nr:MFS transporter [Gemmatimonadota bacterium]NIQ54201.1 MFS transporter [Gemmatimonadota bacterium]NIU74401.1 MFS transporter [Gammaproteobacteria bacterium]NIX44387.1 MFS transporter [Gemmatimonadota bacterium]NIY08606.1 MFS transporter [Gemmatimonadota bacterium]